jgi:uncharacterized protein YuzE
MRITYDHQADAAYFYLTEIVDNPDTRTVTDDVYLDFDEHGRLVGVEVLDASKNLDLKYLEPQLENLDQLGVCWSQLHRELAKRKQEGIPVVTPVRQLNNWIEEVGKDHVTVRSEQTGNLRQITRKEIEDRDVEKHKGKRRIIVALREIGGYT